MSDAGKAVELTYPIVRADYRALNEFLWDRRIDAGNWFWRLLKWVVRCCVWFYLLGGIVFGLAALLLAFGEGPFDLAFPLGMASIGLIALPLLLRPWDLAALFRKHVIDIQLQIQINAGAVTPDMTLRVTLDRHGLVERTERPGRDPVDERVAWREVGTITATGRHLFVEVRSRGWLIVPLSAFPGMAAFTAFEAALRRLKAEAEPALGQ